MKNILGFLEHYACCKPDKIAFADADSSFTYDSLKATAESIGTALAQKKYCNRPMVIYMDKTVNTLAAMWGITYSGNFYVVLDAAAPVERLNLIMDTLQAVAVLTDEKYWERAKGLHIEGDIYHYDKLCLALKDDILLQKIRNRMIDTDPLYALYTSGSTGVPKGTIVSHKSVMAYTEWVTHAFGLEEHTVFGNQTPFYFSMSVLDVYTTLRNGATLHIIPKKCFSFPMSLLTFLKERHINTIYWVPSALCLVANWNALEYADLPELKHILFAGEVMPVKQLNQWRRQFPQATFANLYGPTEVTDICAYFIVDREFADDESLPIGYPCNNCDVLVMTQDGHRAGKDEEGELLVRGSFLANGYYNNPEKTAEAFIQNPFQSNYPETVYKTGDLVRYNERGELMYISRKDFQIKRMGYRIELGEIEAAVSALEGVGACAAVYIEGKKQLLLFIQGTGVKEDMIWVCMQNRLPSYMHPNRLILMRKMPYNANGKIDRIALMKSNEAIEQ